MIGKIKEFNFKSLLIFNTFALIATSYIFNSFIFVGVFTLFFFISLFTTKIGLRIIKKLNLLQNIRAEGPANHFKKSYTPTMGGIFMIIPFLIFLLLITINLSSLILFFLFLTIFGFFITGFLDDYLSIKNKDNTGLKTKEKFILQSIISIIFIFLAYEKNLIDPLITVSDSWGINTNIFILPISFLVLVGMSNSVNLTDGLDGLAIVPVMIVAMSFAFIAYISGNIVFSNYLLIQYIPGTGELAVFCGSLIGAALGFLWFNAPPAKVFMGDTGSLALGGSLGSIAIICKHEILLAIIGGLFVLETLSVVIQVFIFKMTGKRVFLMAPLHHHFEKKGWPESTIVIRFWIITIVLALIGLATLRIR